MRGFIFLAACLTVAGWTLSAFKLLAYDWVALIPGLLGAGWVARRAAGSWRQFGQETAAALAGWPLAVIAACVLGSALLYPPTALDSLTYRLPRMMFWQQAGCIHHFPTADERLNYMSQGWELCTLPLVQLGGLRWAGVWNIAAWLIGQIVFFGWAQAAGAPAPKARQIAFLASTSTFAVLQACHTGTDLLAVTFLLLALHFLGVFEGTRQPTWINWSALALCLATGVKPHFATLGLPFVLWFVAAPSRPWRAFQWRWLPVLLPLWLVCSPLPSFLMNWRTYGNLTGSAGNESFTGKAPQWNVLLGTGMMGWQMVQPCVNPVALVLNEPLDRAVDRAGLKEISPRFTLKVLPLAMVDTASLGLLTCLWGVVGIWLVRRREPSWVRSWLGWAVVAGAFGFLAALSQMLVFAMGRSFLGFVMLGFPLAIAGWAWASPRLLRWAVPASLVGSVLAVAMNPARPLWPARAVHAALERSGQARLAKAFQPYVQITERNQTARDLVAAIPPGKAVLAAAIAEDRPILPFLLQCGPDLRVVLLNENAQLSDLARLRADYVLLSGGTEEFFPDLCRQLEQSPAFAKLRSQAYISKLVRGPEVWTLYRRKTAAAP